MGDCRDCVVVFDPTGHIGSATIDALLSDEKLPEFRVRVRALVQDPESKSSKLLEEKGVTLFKGDMTDAKAVERVMNGADAMVLVTSSVKNFDATEARVNPKNLSWVPGLQLKQAETVIKAARKFEIQSVVYIGIVGTEYMLKKYKSAQNYSKKWNKSIVYSEKMLIAEELARSGMMWTVIEAPMVMELLASAGQGITKKGTFPSMYKRTVSVGLISCEDIGKIAKMALSDPDDWNKKHFTAMTEKLTPIEQCEQLAQSRGEIGMWDVNQTFRPLLYASARHWALTLDTTEEVFNKVDHRAAIRATKEVLPEAMSLRDWYEKNGFFGKMSWADEGSCVIG